MICIFYSKEDEALLDIRDKLVDLSLAFKMEKSKDAEDILLQEGKTIKTGYEDVNEYLDEIARELDQWWHCYC